MAPEGHAGARRSVLRAVASTPAILLLWSSAPPAVTAQDFRVTTGVTVRETYTDNVELAPEGEEESDFITDITPLVSIRSEGEGRIDVDFDYRLQTFTSGDPDQSINHQLQMIGNAELIKQIGFVDFRATIGQQNIDNTGRVSEDNLSRTGNRTDVITYSVSPYVRHHFGTYADAELRYTFDDVINEGLQGQDSSSNRFAATLVSGRRFTRMPWDVIYDSQTIDNEDGTTSEFERIEGTARYLIDRRYGVFGSLGLDNNDFATSQPDEDGIRWRFGGTWTPSVRTSLELGYGEQFSGSNISFDFFHRSRRTIWQASYGEDVTTVRQLQLDRQLVRLVDDFGEPILDDTGEPILIPIDFPTITDEVIVSKRFDGSVALVGRRTDWRLLAFHDDREFQLSGDTETVFGARLSVGHQMSRRTRASASATWQQSDLESGALEEDRLGATISLNHRFAENVNGTLTYGHTEQTSNEAENEFTENRISARLSVIF